MKKLEKLKNRLEKLNYKSLFSSKKLKTDEPRTIITPSSFDDEDLFMFI